MTFQPNRRLISFVDSSQGRQQDAEDFSLEESRTDDPIFEDRNCFLLRTAIKCQDHSMVVYILIFK